MPPVERIEPALALFAAVLLRVASALAFVPLPGLRQAPTAPKVALALGLALILFPVAWLRTPPLPNLSLGSVAWMVPAEVGLGAGAGLITGWLLEILAMGMQMVSLQAGFSYAAMIDPATQADSGLLPVTGQLAAGLLFVTLGWERELLTAFAMSLEHCPPGSWHARPDLAVMAIQWTASMLSLGVRLALPVTAFLLLADLTLALVGRTQPQLGLLNLAMPVKMSTALLLLALGAPSWSGLMSRAASGFWDALATAGIAR